MKHDQQGRFRVVAAVAAVLGLALLAFGVREVLRDEPAPSVAAVESIPVPAAVTRVAATAPPVAEPTASEFAGEPRKIVAPAIGLDADVLPIRVVDGALTPPRDAAKLGWDEGTSIAGAAEGTSVVAGHTLSGKAGALADLGSFVAGDRIAVLTGKGQIDYVVRSVDTYRKAAIGEVIPELYAADGPNLLVLITCSDWTGTRHLDNTVVVAEPVAS